EETISMAQPAFGAWTGNSENRSASCGAPRMRARNRSACAARVSLSGTCAHNGRDNTSASIFCMSLKYHLIDFVEPARRSQAPQDSRMIGMLPRVFACLLLTVLATFAQTGEPPAAWIDP